jgi:uncharacterized membrane protein
MMVIELPEVIKGKGGSMSTHIQAENSYSVLSNQRKYSRRNVISGYLFGVGLVAFFDEAVFHQLLHWHHFYDKSTTVVGLISDGLFHAFSWFATIGGLFLLADLRRRRAFYKMRWWGGAMLGAGAFQFFDGTIQHKVWRLHQIRYVDNIAIYDWVWNLIALAILVAGIVITVRTGRRLKSGELEHE